MCAQRPIWARGVPGDSVCLYSVKKNQKKKNHKVEKQGACKELDILN